MSQWTRFAVYRHLFQSEVLKSIVVSRLNGLSKAFFDLLCDIFITRFGTCVCADDGPCKAGVHCGSKPPKVR